MVGLECFRSANILLVYKGFNLLQISSDKNSLISDTLKRDIRGSDNVFQGDLTVSGGSTLTTILSLFISITAVSPGLKVPLIMASDKIFST